MGDQLELLALENGDVAEGVDYKNLAQRMEQLQAWAAAH